MESGHVRDADVGFANGCSELASELGYVTDEVLTRSTRYIHPTELRHELRLIHRWLENQMHIVGAAALDHLDALELRTTFIAVPLGERRERILDSFAAGSIQAPLLRR